MSELDQWLKQAEERVKAATSDFSKAIRVIHLYQQNTGVRHKNSCSVRSTECDCQFRFDTELARILKGEA
jgi:hypothetical protein